MGSSLQLLPEGGKCYQQQIGKSLKCCLCIAGKEFPNISHKTILKDYIFCGKESYCPPLESDINMTRTVFMILLPLISVCMSNPTPGADCHNKKYLKCIKIPQHGEHDECEDIIDTAYIEECEDIIETHCDEEHEHVFLHVYHSHVLTEDSVYPVCHDKVSTVCHKVPTTEHHTHCRKVTEFGHKEHCEEIVTRHCKPFHCGSLPLEYCSKLV